MISRRALTACFLMLVALAASAQDPAEYGRATAGEISLTPKASAPFSGSIEFSQSMGGSAFGESNGYGLTAGGTLMKERLWFFAAASRQEGSRAGDFALPENANTGAIGGRVNGQLGASNSFSAFFEAAKRPQFSTTTATPSTFTGIAPTSLLSLRYTGVVSSNMLFSASFSRSTTRVQGFE